MQEVRAGWENEVILGGYISDTPKVFETSSGMKITSLKLSRYTIDKKTKEKTWSSWVVKAFGSEEAQAFAKGDNVTVKGRLTQTSWIDKKSGEKKFGNEIVASSFTKHSAYKKKEEEPSPGFDEFSSQPEVEIPF